MWECVCLSVCMPSQTSVSVLSESFVCYAALWMRVNYAWQALSMPALPDWCAAVPSHDTPSSCPAYASNVQLLPFSPDVSQSSRITIRIRSRSRSSAGTHDSCHVQGRMLETTADAVAPLTCVRDASACHGVRLSLSPFSFRRWQARTVDKPELSAVQRSRAWSKCIYLPARGWRNARAPTANAFWITCHISVSVSVSL